MIKNPCACSILATRVAVTTHANGHTSQLLFCSACGAVLDEKPVAVGGDGVAGPSARQPDASTVASG